MIPVHYFETHGAANRPSNLQSLCKPHHDRKTATVDSAFGRPGSTTQRGQKGG